MDTQDQIELEELFAKNNTMPRLRYDFDIPAVHAHCETWNIPRMFAIDLLSQMVLHKRASLSTLVGLLKHHFDETTKAGLQDCTDMICLAADAGFIGYDPFAWQFVIRNDASKETQDALELFQYPLPMVVPPKEARTNKDTGYFSIRGSLILRDNHHDDDICLDHINRVNKTPLAINTETCRMVQNQWRNLDRKKEGETDDEFKARVKAFEKFDRSSREILEAVYMSGEPFYLTHKYDKRGRCYAQGYQVNPQGNAWQKAMVEFAEQELVT